MYDTDVLETTGNQFTSSPSPSDDKQNESPGFTGWLFVQSFYLIKDNKPGFCLQAL